MLKPVRHAGDPGENEGRRHSVNRRRKMFFLLRREVVVNASPTHKGELGGAYLRRRRVTQIFARFSTSLTSSLMFTWVCAPWAHPDCRDAFAPELHSFQWKVDVNAHKCTFLASAFKLLLSRVTTHVFKSVFRLNVRLLSTDSKLNQLNFDPSGTRVWMASFPKPTVW